MERFKKFGVPRHNMETPELDLDTILIQCKQDGILLKVDDRWTQHRMYRFVLDTTVANGIVEQLIMELRQNPLYDVVAKESKVIENGYRIEFDYRIPLNAQQRSRLSSIGNLVRGLRRDSDSELNHFATIFVLDLPLEEKIKLERESKDAKDKSVFVIDSLDANYGSHQATLHLMRTFYSAYQKFKTPLKILPVHLPSQNP